MAETSVSGGSEAAADTQVTQVTLLVLVRALSAVDYPLRSPELRCFVLFSSAVSR